VVKRQRDPTVQKGYSGFDVERSGGGIEYIGNCNRYTTKHNLLKIHLSVIFEPTELFRMSEIKY